MKKRLTIRHEAFIPNAKVFFFDKIFGSTKEMFYICRKLLKKVSTMTDIESLFFDRLKSVAQMVIPSGGKAWLYGSRARGDSHHDSDWDLLILIHKDRITSKDEDDISYPFVELGWHNATAVSPQLYTFEEWEKLQQTPYFQNVEHDKLPLI